MYQKLPNKEQVYYLDPVVADFEQAYIAIREKEERVLSDEEVWMLPHLQPDHKRYREWQKRAFTTHKVLNYLSARKYESVLDLGCGNGWFTHLLAQTTKAQVIGVDKNELELQQAARLFTAPNCRFMYADIFSDNWPKAYFDIVFLNACVQYFQDIDALLKQLFALLKTGGEIHFLDSPFYKQSEVEQAQKRTADYYEQNGVSAMTAYYHHHTWASLSPYNTKVLYKPKTLLNQVKRKFNIAISPFPWLIVTK